MPKESFGAVVRRRSLGLLMLVLVVALVALSIAIYNKVFTPIVKVTLKTNAIGNQLQVHSDVKERGVIVGEVKAIRANGSDAMVTLSLQPSRVKDIPKNVTAEILPKTLFGEQYVALQLPSKSSDGQSNDPIAAGDVIYQDRSRASLDAQDVLNSLYPVLTYVQPAELNSTLTAIATALNGRGKELGQTLVTLHKYLLKLNPHANQLVDDIDKLGRVSLEYNHVSPDLFGLLKNLETTMQTVYNRRAALHDLLTTGSSTANVLSSFLAQNRSRLIQVAGQGRKITALLAEYSPEFSCLAQGVNELADGAGSAIYNHSIHLNITVDVGTSSSPANAKPNQSRGPYRPGQQPSLITGFGPNCFGLPNNPTPTVRGNFQIPPKFQCINDGAPLSEAPCARRRTQNPSSADERSLTTSSTSSQNLNSVGSATETAIVNSLIASQLGTTPNKVPGGSTLLVAPLLRGHKVIVK